MAKSAPAQPRSPWVFPFCPQPPGWELDWPAVQNDFAWIGPMADCQQDPAWHAEGNVLVHTKMVCEALVAMDSSRRALPRRAIRALRRGPAARRGQAVGDAGGERPHPFAPPRCQGCATARTILWEELLPAVSLENFYLREQIVALVHHHPLPLQFLNVADPRREVITVSQVVRLDWVAMLAEADAAGREAANRTELLERVELFRELAQENRCYTEPRRFASPHTRVLYFHGRELDSDVEAYDNTRMEVIVMCGLPGAGKDRWIAENAGGWPVVSLDAIRGDLGIGPEDNQGVVVAQAKELARGRLRQGRQLIWNATNTTRTMRRQLIGLLTDYHAHVRIVYVETAWDEVLRRNHARTNRVPEDVLRRLAEKLEIPDLTEVHQVEYRVT